LEAPHCFVVVVEIIMLFLKELVKHN